MKHFLSDGVDIAFVEQGAGPPILLIHGFGSNHAVNWESTGWIATLTAAGRRVIAMDVRGHGESAKLYDQAAYRPELMAGDAANLLGHLGVAEADVMGYSMGGRIASHLAIDHPRHVHSLVGGGMGMAIVEGSSGVDEIVAALEARGVDDVRGVLGRTYRKFADQTGSDRRALAACMRALREPMPAERLSRIAAPVLIAVGTRDRMAASAADLARLIPGAEFLAIPDRDHLPATGDKVFKAGALDFLRRRGLPALS